MKVLAVDPGQSGAVVRLHFPAMHLEARRDFKSLADIARAVRDLLPAEHGVIELVSAMPGQGVVSMFSFGRATGVAMGAFLFAGQPFVEIQPQRWQTYWRDLMCRPGEPFDSIIVARQVFPAQVDLFTRKKDHGTADAALLAAYAARELAEHGTLETSRKKDARSVYGRA